LNIAWNRASRNPPLPEGVPMLRRMQNYLK
jgi:hypothetical protein